MVFVIHWHELAMDLHVFPIPISPPISLSTRSLWLFPVAKKHMKRCSLNITHYQRNAKLSLLRRETQTRMWKLFVKVTRHLLHIWSRYLTLDFEAECSLPCSRPPLSLFILPFPKKEPGGKFTVMCASHEFKSWFCYLTISRPRVTYRLFSCEREIEPLYEGQPLNLVTGVSRQLTLWLSVNVSPALLPPSSSSLSFPWLWGTSNVWWEVLLEVPKPICLHGSRVHLSFQLLRKTW